MCFIGGKDPYGWLFAHMRHGLFTKVNWSYPYQHRLLEDIILTLLQLVKWQYYGQMSTRNMDRSFRVWGMSESSPDHNNCFTYEMPLRIIWNNWHYLYSSRHLTRCIPLLWKYKTNRNMECNTHHIYRANWLLERVAKIKVKSHTQNQGNSSKSSAMPVPTDRQTHRQLHKLRDSMTTTADDQVFYSSFYSTWLAENDG